MAKKRRAAKKKAAKKSPPRAARRKAYSKSLRAVQKAQKNLDLRVKKHHQVVSSMFFPA